MIKLKTIDQIKRIDESCEIVLSTLDEASKLVCDGNSTLDIDKFIESRIDHKNAISGRGYRGYPAVSCISVNQEIVHGIPSSGTVLKHGDMVTIDLFLKKNGIWGDSANTYLVCDTEDCDEDHSIQKTLISVAEEAFRNSMIAMRSGDFISDITDAISNTISMRGFKTSRQFTGHGIGESLHEQPHIPCKRPVQHNIKVSNGLVVAVEPIVHEKGSDAFISDDGWTAISVDGGLSSHFERCLAVVEDKTIMLGVGEFDEL